MKKKKIFGIRDAVVGGIFAILAATGVSVAPWVAPTVTVVSDAAINGLVDDTDGGNHVNVKAGEDGNDQ